MVNEVSIILISFDICVKIRQLIATVLDQTIDFTVVIAHPDLLMPINIMGNVSRHSAVILI